MVMYRDSEVNQDLPVRRISSPWPVRAGSARWLVHSTPCGYHDYRRSDAAAVRRLQRGPMAIGRLGTTLGVSRQTARKVATGLERRGFATTVRDTNDSRQINVTLTADGEEYAKALTKVIDRLNRDLYRRVDPVDLAGADAVLRAVLVDDHTRKVAQYLAPP